MVLCGLVNINIPKAYHRVLTQYTGHNYRRVMLPKAFPWEYRRDEACTGGGAWVLRTATKPELRRILASTGLRPANHLPFEDKLKVEASELANSEGKVIENYDEMQVLI